MEGIAERDRRGIERDVAQAWWIERLARENRLQRLGDYVEQLRPRKPKTADEMLAVFREHQARGAPMTIRHFGPDGKELN